MFEKFIGSKALTLQISGNSVILRHYAAIQKVADSIPDEITGFFNFLPAALWPWSRLSF
jgi:hypothetical protein